MSIVSKSEKDDFQSLITDAGFNAADFDLQETEYAPEDGVFAVRGKVSIRRKAMGAVREYAAGHMSTWLADFDRDLRSGAFGKA